MKDLTLEYHYKKIREKHYSINAIVLKLLKYNPLKGK